MHDIGKAIDRDLQGTHLELGIDFLRKHGENEAVVMAVAAHHMDIDWPSLEAMIVQAADAISAARPGARRDILESYVKRLEKLEGIADSFPRRLEGVRAPGRPRDPHPGREREDLGRGDRLALEGHREAHRERAGVPGADQGHRHSRDACRRIRAVGILTADPRSLASGLTEAGLIDFITQRLPPPPAWLRVPVGDDAAVVEAERGTLEVLTTDTLVEGVHFDFSFCSPADVGAKAVAVNLSDLAAMGAAPRAALVSFCVPRRMTRDALEAMIDALVSSAATYGLTIVGGNVASSPGPLVVTIAATGSVRPRRALLRSGARPGDAIYVSAAIGAAAAGLGMLREGRSPSAEDEAQCVGRYRAPVARVRLGLLLGRTRAATACIDLSDGLADGARRLGQASGAGILLEADAIPVHPAARRYFSERGLDPIAAALAGGDDYELLFASAPRRRGALAAAVRRSPGLAVTRIGVVTKEPEVRLRRDGRDEPLPEGFQHF